MKNKYTHQCAVPIILCLLITFNSSPIFSQDQPKNRITGVVSDETGPLAGANVLIKNSNQGTITDLDGTYSIRASPADTLVFTYIGYLTQETPVQLKTRIDVTLVTDETSLDQVVINAGYYKVSERERTGSISRITAEEIADQPINNPLEALQGRMAGVNITTTSGVPGAGFTVRIRGQNSIMGGNDPLYIIDGVPFDSQSLSNHISSGGIIPNGNVNPLDAISPDAIESIEVLKDADATAIYGSRGANGVVLISTKKGKPGKTSFYFGSSTGIAHITKKRELLNTQQYLEMRREAFANDGITEYPENAYDINGTWDLNRYTDWQEVLTGNTANTRQIQGSVSGGTHSTRFLLNGRYQNETSVFPGSFNYDKATFNSSLQHTDQSKKFNLDLNVGYTLQNNYLPSSDLSYNAAFLSPNAPSLFDDSGNVNWENGTWNNPAAQFENIYKSSSNTLFSSLMLSYKLWNDLDIKLNAGYGTSELADRTIAPHTAYNPAWGMTSANSMITTNEGNKKNWILEPQLTWNKIWKDMTLNILLGGTFQKQEFAQYGVYAIGFPTNDFINNLSAATTILVNNELSTEYNTQSWFARLNYGFKDMLFLNVTGRRDGSSRFGPGNKYGNFGALGIAYLFSDDLNIEWLPYGKLRGSYGLSGNDQIGDYQYLRTFTISDQSYDGNIGIQPSRLYNPYFQWEENRKGEVALELGFLKNKISLSASYYNNRSSNQLINYALPSTTGFESILTNLDAEVENKGWEFDLMIHQVQTQDFKWMSSINFSLARNKLLAFPGLENSTYANRYVIGEPLSIVKLYKLKGVNPDTGLFEFEDYNNDGILNARDDKQYIADLTPKYFGGIANVILYKKWELNVFFQFVKKKGYNQYRLTEPAGTFANQPSSVLDRWQQPGDMTTMQRFTSGADFDAYNAYYQFTQSSGIISDASFIRLKTLTLAYTLSNQYLSNNSCRLFLSGQNLLTFTKFKGGDPEQSDEYLAPLTRISFGFQLNL